jgi:hypothetical protein
LRRTIPDTSMMFLNSAVQPSRFRRPWLTDVGDTLRSQRLQRRTHRNSWFLVTSPLSIILSRIAKRLFVVCVSRRPRAERGILLLVSSMVASSLRSPLPWPSGDVHRLQSIFLGCGARRGVEVTRALSLLLCGWWRRRIDPYTAEARDKPLTSRKEGIGSTTCVTEPVDVRLRPRRLQPSTESRLTRCRYPRGHPVRICVAETAPTIDDYATRLHRIGLRKQGHVYDCVQVDCDRSCIAIASRSPLSP